ncbi:Uncharacterised protein [Yersinia intermedia]|uniref:hypothetical protein n=1 Tax=Yersinia intermedia TaxID=631 RepID=UPI0005E1CA9A|nr:hypothetical protein [Yersinia intermedia]CNH58043.1 Uncharacterised protein [Yersinia intermedia]
MLIPTDILRAALLCVAGEKETREYLKGVYITPTHIKATDGRALVMWSMAVKSVMILMACLSLMVTFLTKPSRPK